MGSNSSRLSTVLGSPDEQAAQSDERECFAWVWDACAEMDSYVQMSLTRGDTSLRNKVFGDEWSWLEVTSFASLMESRPQSGINSSRQSSEGVSLSLDEALSKYAKIS